MMGHYRYPKSTGWGHTGDIAHNFKGIDFYEDFTKVANDIGEDIYASKAVSMKTTTTTNVKNWLASSPVQKNLNNLETGFENGITWTGTTIRYNKAEVHIYMPKSSITDELKETWLNKLKSERPNIEFKINALEDFVK